METFVPVAPSTVLTLAHRDALLVCEKCPHPTKHRIVRREAVGMVGDYALIFACKGCGAERRYGLTGPKTGVDD